MGKLIIGKVINTRGLKGEMKIDNRSSFIKDRYKAGNVIYLSKDEENFIEKVKLVYQVTLPSNTSNYTIKDLLGDLNLSSQTIVAKQNGELTIEENVINDGDEIKLIQIIYGG